MDATQLRLFKKGATVTLTHKTKPGLVVRGAILYEYDNGLGRLEVMQGRALFMVTPNDKFWAIE
jgi:hypothetical protein